MASTGSASVAGFPQANEIIPGVRSTISRVRAIGETLPRRSGPAKSASSSGTRVLIGGVVEILAEISGAA